MIRNKAYYLQIIGTTTYLIPTGQMKSDHRKSIVINSVGEYIWNLLENEKTMQEIIEECISYYEASEEEKSELTGDVEQFVEMLLKNQVILENEMKPVDYLEQIESVVIANTKISFYGDRNIYPERFERFVTLDRRVEDIRIELVNNSLDPVNDRKLLVENELLRVVESKERYILEFPQSREVFGCQISKDGRLVRIHAVHSLSKESLQLVFDSVRVAFSYRLLMEDMIAIHSASILYKEKAWLFSAPAGTGKSTHANLWKEAFNVNTINGDLNFMIMENDKPVIYGTPWCGTSGIYDNEVHELGGIIFLKRNDENYTEEITEEEKILLISKRLVSPAWNESLMAKQFEVASAISDRITVTRLNCNKETKAAVVMKQYIDNIQ